MNLTSDDTLDTKIMHIRLLAYEVFDCWTGF